MGRYGSHKSTFQGFSPLKLSGCLARIAGHGSFNPGKVSGESGVDTSVIRTSASLSVGSDANLNSIN